MLSCGIPLRRKEVSTPCGLSWRNCSICGGKVFVGMGSRIQWRGMTVALTILTDPRRAEPRRELAVAPGTTILRAAHDAGIDVTATCGGRGRCTSCRVKFVSGSVPPPTIGDEVQLGDEQVREGYRLACQCAPTEAVT